MDNLAFSWIMRNSPLLLFSKCLFIREIFTLTRGSGDYHEQTSNPIYFQFFTFDHPVLLLGNSCRWLHRIVNKNLQDIRERENIEFKISGYFYHWNLSLWITKRMNVSEWTLQIFLFISLFELHYWAKRGVNSLILFGHFYVRFNR